MKYYKIVNPKGHHGLVYHEGLNTDPVYFHPYGDCEPGGIYFAREDILSFIGFGAELYEVEPVGEVYKNPSDDGAPQKWKAHSVVLKHIGKICDLNNIKMLVEQGADIHTYDECALRFSAKCGHLNVVKYLVEQGADIHIYADCPLAHAVVFDHLDVVKYLVEQGSNVHAEYDKPLRYAVRYGHIYIIKYLIKHGADISVLSKKKIRLKCYIYRYFNIWFN